MNGLTMMLGAVVAALSVDARIISRTRYGLAVLLIGLATNTAAAAACNVTPPQGAAGYWWAGGEQYGSTVLYASSASISVMSPVSPVYTGGGASVWTALYNQTTCSPTCGAQVGWLVTNTHTSPTIFSQYTNASGQYYPITYYGCPLKFRMSRGE